MKTNVHRIILTVTSALVVATGLVLFSSGASLQNSNKTKRNQENGERVRHELQSRFPVTDYNSPEPTDPEEKQKRRNKSKHYDGKRLLVSNPETATTGVTEDSEVFFNLPALPASRSTVILIADVLNSGAYISNTKSAVYSEFTVQVNKVLKGALPTFSQTNLISISRLGGMVQYPSGQRVLHTITNQNMPLVGGRYLFFLKSTEESQTYEIVTGYEIRSDHVLPLDEGSQFEAFRGRGLTVFLQKVREAIATN